MKIDKSIIVSLMTIVIISTFSSCKYFTSYQQEKAEEQFVKEVQYMTEQDALSKEIDYYKAPEITVSRHNRSLTGKDLIHECNRLMKEDEEKKMIDIGFMKFKITRANIGEVKKYAIEHPNDDIANEFYFEGIFTHYNNGYDTRRAYVIYIPEIEEYIVEQVYK